MRQPSDKRPRRRFSDKDIKRFKVEHDDTLLNYLFTLFGDKSNQMSGGQMQRVAIARALALHPAVILADEATGNLDTRTSFEVLVLFQKLHAEGRTIIFVTHNPEIARYSSRNITLRDGRVTGDVLNGNILDAAATLASIPVEED